MFPSYLEVEKNWFLAISSQTNTVAAIWREKKSGSLLFGDLKMQSTTVMRKEKDYDIYLKSEKTGSQPVGARKKMFPSYLEVEKNWFLAISSLTNTVAAYWREKKDDPCYLGTKKCSSQLLGARKRL